jgi:hypothetical protein
MLDLSPEDQVSLEQSLQQAARILKKYTESDKLKDFESIEAELRHQVVTIVSPTIAEFFLPQHPKASVARESSKACLGNSESLINKPEH